MFGTRPGFAKVMRGDVLIPGEQPFRPDECLQICGPFNRHFSSVRLVALHDWGLFTILNWIVSEWVVPLQSKASRPSGMMGMLGQSPNLIGLLLGHRRWWDYKKLAPLWVASFVFWERAFICINPYWDIMRGAVPIHGQHPLSINQCLFVCLHNITLH